jgi:hypothetical protein
VNPTAPGRFAEQNYGCRWWKMSAIASAIAAREFDRLTVDADQQGARTDLTSGHNGTKSGNRNVKRRRASKRAPATFQQLDDSDLLSEGAARLPAG